MRNNTSSDIEKRSRESSNKKNDNLDLSIFDCLKEENRKSHEKNRKNANQQKFHKQIIINNTQNQKLKKLKPSQKKQEKNFIFVELSLEGPKNTIHKNHRAFLTKENCSASKKEEKNEINNVKYFTNAEKLKNKVNEKQIIHENTTDKSRNQHKSLVTIKNAKKGLANQNKKLVKIELPSKINKKIKIEKIEVSNVKSSANIKSISNPNLFSENLGGKVKSQHEGCYSSIERDKKSTALSEPAGNIQISPPATSENNLKELNNNFDLTSKILLANSGPQAVSSINNQNINKLQIYGKNSDQNSAFNNLNNIFYDYGSNHMNYLNFINHLQNYKNLPTLQIQNKSQALAWKTQNKISTTFNLPGYNVYNNNHYENFKKLNNNANFINESNSSVNLNKNNWNIGTGNIIYPNTRIDFNALYKNNKENHFLQKKRNNENKFKNNKTYYEDHDRLLVEEKVSKLDFRKIENCNCKFASDKEKNNNKNESWSANKENTNEDSKNLWAYASYKFEQVKSKKPLISSNISQPPKTRSNDFSQVKEDSNCNLLVSKAQFNTGKIDLVENKINSFQINIADLFLDEEFSKLLNNFFDEKNNKHESEKNNCMEKISIVQINAFLQHLQSFKKSI